MKKLLKGIGIVPIVSPTAGLDWAVLGPMLLALHAKNDVATGKVKMVENTIATKYAAYKIRVANKRR